MNTINVILCIAVLALVAYGYYCRWVYGTSWIFRMKGLTRVCVHCEQPLPRPRPKHCPFCGAKVQWRYFP